MTELLNSSITRLLGNKQLMEDIVHNGLGQLNSVDRYGEFTLSNDKPFVRLLQFSFIFVFVTANLSGCNLFAAEANPSSLPFGKVSLDLMRKFNYSNPVGCKAVELTLSERRILSISGNRLLETQKRTLRGRLDDGYS